MRVSIFVSRQTLRNLIRNDFSKWYFDQYKIYLSGIKEFCGYLSSPEIGLRRRSSVRGRPQSLNIFSSETKAQSKSNMEFIWDGGTKVCENNPSHIN